MFKLLILALLIVKSCIGGSGFSMSNIPSNKTVLSTPFYKHTYQVINIPIPFISDYGIYCLSDTGHSYQDYFSNINIDYDATHEYFLIQAPYLIYVNEDNRYVNDIVVNTVSEEETSENTYDLWDETYNKQPYVTSSTPFTVNGYWGDTFVRALSYTIDGNSFESNKYYLQNLRIYLTSSLNNINNIRLIINDYCFSSGYTSSTIQEVRPYQMPDEYSSVSPTQPGTGGFARNEIRLLEQEFTFTAGYSIDSFTVSVSGASGSFSNRRIITNDSINGRGKVEATFTSSKSTIKPYTFTFNVTLKKAGQLVNATYNITAPSGPLISSSTNLGSININAHPDWYETYFLDTITCSGRGDYSDRELITSRWNEVEVCFNALPSSNKERILLAEDSDLFSMYERYDYCVFFKNYGLNDFLNRENNINRYYSSNPTSFVIYQDNTSFIIIIASNSIILLSTLTLIFLVKRKRSNQEA